MPIVKVCFSSLIKGRYLMISPRLAVFLRRTVPAHIMEMFILQEKDTQRNANLGNHSYNIFLTWNNNILITFSCVLYKKGPKPLPMCVAHLLDHHLFNKIYSHLIGEANCQSHQD